MSKKEVRIKLSKKDVKEMTRGALSRHYTAMSKIYCGKRVPTYIKDNCTPSTDGHEIHMSECKELKKKVGLSDVNFCRANHDTFAHECWHINEGHTEEQIETFLEEAGSNTWAKLCLNAVMDARIDYMRARKYSGMAINQAWIHKLYYDTYAKPMSKCKNITERVFQGTTQMLAVGKIKRRKKLSDEEEEFFKNARTALDAARRTKDYGMLKAFAQYICDAGMALGIEPPEIVKMPGCAGEIIIRKSGKCPPGGGYNFVDLPESVRKKIEEAMEELEDDEESDDEASVKSWHGVPQHESLEGSKADVSRSEHMKEAVRDYALEHDSQEIINRVENTKRNWHSRRELNAGKVIEELDRLLRRIRHRTGRRHSKKGKRIDVKRYIRYKCGTPNTDFYYKDVAQHPGDRSICVLIDCSGSMEGMIQEASLAAYAISYVAEKLDDKVCVFGYDHGPGGAGDIIKIKSWNEPIRKMDFERIHAGGWTPTPMAIKTGMHFLDIAPKQKKLMIVIEDGGPNVALQDTSGKPYPGLSNDAFVQCQQLVNIVRNRGSKVLGIYIGESSTNTYIRNRMESLYGRGQYIVIPNINFLAKHLLNFYIREMGMSNV